MYRWSLDYAIFGPKNTVYLEIHTWILSDRGSSNSGDSNSAVSLQCDLPLSHTLVQIQIVVRFRIARYIFGTQYARCSRTYCTTWILRSQNLHSSMLYNDVCTMQLKDLGGKFQTAHHLGPCTPRPLTSRTPCTCTSIVREKERSLISLLFPWNFARSYLPTFSLS